MHIIFTTFNLYNQGISEPKADAFRPKADGCFGQLSVSTTEGFSTTALGQHCLSHGDIWIQPFLVDRLETQQMFRGNFFTTYIRAAHSGALIEGVLEQATELNPQGGPLGYPTL